MIQHLLCSCHLGRGFTPTLETSGQFWPLFWQSRMTRSALWEKLQGLACLGSVTQAKHGSVFWNSRAAYRGIFKWKKSKGNFILKLFSHMIWYLRLICAISELELKIPFLTRHSSKTTTHSPTMATTLMSWVSHTPASPAVISSGTIGKRVTWSKDV